jgi:hypothetical protein
MVSGSKQHTAPGPVKQGPPEVAPEPNKIGASTPYDYVTFCYTSLSL